MDPTTPIIPSPFAPQPPDSADREKALARLDQEWADRRRRLLTRNGSIPTRGRAVFLMAAAGVVSLFWLGNGIINVRVSPGVSVLSFILAVLSLGGGFYLGKRHLLGANVYREQFRLHQLRRGELLRAQRIL